MDKQMEFLMTWATICQKMVDWYLEQVQMHGPNKAKLRWIVKMEQCMADEIPNPLNLPEIALSNQMCQTAVLYMDCMIRWGVFDG
jgi:hypothetical protein